MDNFSQYLAVPAHAVEFLEPYEPVYGELLDDGRIICKVRIPIVHLPAGVDPISNSPSEARGLVYDPKGDKRFKVKIAKVDKYEEIFDVLNSQEE